MQAKYMERAISRHELEVEEIRLKQAQRSLKKSALEIAIGRIGGAFECIGGLVVVLEQPLLAQMFIDSYNAHGVDTARITHDPTFWVFMVSGAVLGSYAFVDGVSRLSSGKGIRTS